MRVLMLLVVVLLWVGPAWAANHYILQGGTGAQTGNDWANALPDLPASGSPHASTSLVRGDTYFMGAGTYAAIELTDAESGALVITIQRATIDNHGTATGWNNAYDGTVTWTYDTSRNASIVFRRGYYTFDGVTGSMSSNVADYGYRIGPSSTCGASGSQQYLVVGASGVPISHIIIQHVGVFGCGQASTSNAMQAFFIGFGGAGAVTNVLLSHNYSGSVLQGIISWASNSIYEYHYFGTGYLDAGSAHGEAVASIAGTNIDFRYNYFQNCVSTACMAALDQGPLLNAMDNWRIYGNVFTNVVSGNGIIATGTDGSIYLTNVLAYNNTIASSGSTLFHQCGSPTPCASASGNVFENNLIYNSLSIIDAGTGAAITHDYNAFCSPTDTPPAEAHRQTGCGNLFVSSGTGNFHLAINTNAGLTLGAPYTTDPDGHTRTTWSRGAYEFGSGGDVTPPAAPTGVVISRVTAGRAN